MMVHYKGIDHVQLVAPPGSEPEAREFYTGILRFEEVEKPKTLQQRGGAWFEAGNINIHIGIEKEFTPARKAHPAIEVENIEALGKYLKTKDINVTWDDRLPGVKRFYINDPFENRIEFLQKLERKE